MTDAAILQTRLPFDATPRRLPGVAPLDPGDWLHTDEAHAAQMALRDRLIAQRPEKVLRLDPAARPAADELLDTVLSHLMPRPGYRVGRDEVTRPDGIAVPLDRDHPMATLGRLAQEDFCLLEKRGDEHVLTAAALCFPAGWSLDEKFLRPLVRIHAPVAEYDADLARRVQRLFDGVQPGRPLWRFNHLPYSDPALFQPMREADRRKPPTEAAPYLRSERQCIVRLPRSRAVVFSIHTYVLLRSEQPADRGQRSA